MKIFIAFFIILLFTGCEKTDLNKHTSDNDYIRYGTSFGECIGYCNRAIEVTDSKIELLKKGWDMDGILPEQKQSEPIDQSFWNNMNETLDFNSFRQLDSIIGCPDCADGGAEWIEVKRNNQIQKVIFEYGNEPEILSELLGYLHTFLISIDVDSTKSATFNERTLINKYGKIKNFLCSRGCNQYLIECIKDGETYYYFDKYLDIDFQTDGLPIQFNGVLQNDSTMINKPAPNDIPIPDFKARNIVLIDLKTNSN